MSSSSGTFSVSGLVSGLDTKTLISQLMTIERQPITRVQNQISTLQAEKTAMQGLRTTLLTLTNAVKDFKLKDVFGQYGVTSSESTVATTSVTGANPVSGAYTIHVSQLASATIAKSSATLGAKIDPAAKLNASGISSSIEAGTFTINGVTLNVDPATQSLNDVLSAINSSGAGVTATYDSATDTVTFANTAAGNTNMINFGATADTGTFLDALNVKGATQLSNGSGSTSVTSTKNLGALDTSQTLDTMNFAGGTVTSGTFSINGVSITVDSASDTLGDVLQRINDSDAGVVATYDASSDKIQVRSNTLGSRTVSFASGTSNFLSLSNLTNATQAVGTDAKFTVNGGAEQTRNTNEVTDAINGITVNLLSTGDTTVTVKTDNSGIVDSVKKVIEAFNTAITEIGTATASDGTLANQGDIQAIANNLWNTSFSQVTGLSGSYTNLAQLGITTGSAFDASAVQQLELDETTFTEALTKSRSNVAEVFNNSDGTGIMDQLTSYLDSVSGTTGFLYDRVKSNGSIDRDISDLNNRITDMTERADAKEKQLKDKYAKLETQLSTLKAQSSYFSSWSSSI